ncbi:MAG: hypothetical protein LBN00_08200 [Oscillospiraceae bacterium]|nr:hypothetical protein [Oscillospiraceae bacterium]
MKVTKRLLTLITILAIILSAMSFTVYATEPEVEEPIIEEPIAAEGNGGIHMNVNLLGHTVTWSAKTSTVTGFTGYITMSNSTIAVATMTSASGTLTIPSSVSGALYYQGSVNYGTATIVITQTALGFV